MVVFYSPKIKIEVMPQNAPFVLEIIHEHSIYYHTIEMIYRYAIFLKIFTDME